MKHLFILFFIITSTAFSQVKVSGVVLDESNEPVPFANVVFKGSIIGTVSDENGKFYLESEKTYTQLEVSFLGFEKTTVPLKARNFNLKIILKEDSASLDEVIVYSGKQKKKGNPAIAILRKIWAKNGKMEFISTSNMSMTSMKR